MRSVRARAQRVATLLCTVGLSLIAATASRPLTAQSPTRAAASERVLLVVSAAGRDSGRTRPGFELDELSQAWLLFRANGFDVTIASPTGGAVVADPFDATLDYNARFLADTAAVRQLRHTARTDAVRSGDYRAVFVLGGKGAMFDLPQDAALATLVSQVHARGGIVGAVCHGPAGLVGARTPDGRPLLAGRTVTGFTDEEEQVFGKQWRPQFPWLLETHIRGLGAQWQEAGLMQPFVVSDERVITGQNPFATGETVETIIRALGRTPVARIAWRDERSARFAREALALDPDVAARRFARERDSLQVGIIGLMGYYQLQAATSDVQVRQALQLMELAAPFMPEPELTLGMADAHARLGAPARARALAELVASTHPEHASTARALLARLSTAP
jgi:putative intracellular protease/amidase